ncbi:MAG: hypothetical protein ACRDZW_07835, partial [Acidimicrobiales bacterium]
MASAWHAAVGTIPYRVPVAGGGTVVVRVPGRRSLLNRLDQAEQRLALRAAAVAAVVFIGLYAASFDELRYVLIAAIGVAMAGLLALAARSGRRLATGAAALLVSFGPWSFAWILGAPFLALDGWLALRARPRRAVGASDEPAA